MLFNSLEYILLFLPLTAILYFSLIKYRILLGAKILLIAASLFFYSYYNIKYLPLILLSVVFNYTLGTLIAKHNFTAYAKCKIQKQSMLIFGIIFNIALLAYFKYADFIIDNINALFQKEFIHLNIVLPLAISFFTFQQIAYLVDSYSGKTQEYDFLTYTLFVTFFPQLIACPIVSHHEMIPQFYKVKNLLKNNKNIFLGLYILAIGLFKKVVVADTFAQYATLGFDKIENLTIIGGWFSSLSYTIQIYFDFSGYCDMAIGSALLFNIKLPINFNSPYKSLNIQDFWRRWHITLSRFLRDYLYIPFGGNRKGEIRACLNVLAVFIIGGLWHGAAYTFIIWGFLHGLANVIYRIWKKLNLHMHKIFAWFITFNFINIAWIFFRAKDFGSAFKILHSMIDYTSLENLPKFRARYYLEGFDCHTNSIIYLILIIIFCVIAPNSLELIKKVSVKSTKQALFHGILLGLIFVIAILKIMIIPYSEFIYFNF